MQPLLPSDSYSLRSHPPSFWQPDTYLTLTLGPRPSHNNLSFITFFSIVQVLSQKLWLTQSFQNKLKIELYSLYFNVCYELLFLIVACLPYVLMILFCVVFPTAVPCWPSLTDLNDCLSLPATLPSQDTKNRACPRFLFSQMQSQIVSDSVKLSATPICCGLYLPGCSSFKNFVFIVLFFFSYLFPTSWSHSTIQNYFPKYSSSIDKW